MTYDVIDAPESDYLYLKASTLSNAGQGLFTAIPIYKNEIIALFKGERLSQEEAHRRKVLGEDDYFMNALDGTVFDCMHVPGFAKYANDPKAFIDGMQTISKKKINAEITINHDDEVCLVAMKNIKAGEEIFCEYGKAYWKNFNQKSKLTLK
jgi:SET domain-containing protein